MYGGKVEICGVNTARLPTLSSKEKRELLRKARAGDAEARERLIDGNLRLVLSLVGRFSNRRENMDDLFQVGCIGLIKAVDNFNTDLDVEFSTYAVPMISGEIRRYLRDNNTIRVSRSVRDLAYRALAAKEKLSADGEPTLDEVAREIGETTADVSRALEAITEPVSLYEEAARALKDHPAIWGLDLGDEPSALDFPHYGRLFEAALRLFPHHFPYLNLYPNYASVPENTASQRRSQLGVPTYQDYIDEYARCVPSDYICYDYYMYAITISGAYENLRVVANKCRETGRDLWIVLQVNSNRPEEWMSLDQLRHQAYTALAFGAKSINWACWTAGWWHNEVLDGEGNQTRQYARVCAMNRELHALGERYMRYRNESTHFLGAIDADRLTGVNQGLESSVDAGSFRSVRGENGAGVILGHMTDGTRDALMAAEVTGRAETFLTFTATKGRPRALLNGLPAPVLPVGENEWRVRLEPWCGALIELD